MDSNFTDQQFLIWFTGWYLITENPPSRLLNVCGKKHCVNTNHWIPDYKENREALHCTAKDES